MVRKINFNSVIKIIYEMSSCSNIILEYHQLVINKSIGY